MVPGPYRIVPCGRSSRVVLASQFQPGQGWVVGQFTGRLRAAGFVLGPDRVAE